jgi:pilus assembly protein CpaE
VTTTAANLAVEIAQTTKQRTLLADLDLQLGGSAIVLGIRPRYSVLEVVRNLHRMDRELLDSFVEIHESGLTVLASPAELRPEEDGPSRDQIRAVFQFLRRQFEWIVVDLGHLLTPPTMAVLEAADSVLLLTTPDVVSLNHSKRALPLVERAVGDAKAVHVVLNQRQMSDLITSADVRKTLGHDVYLTLSKDDQNITESVNSGKPIMSRRKSKFARDLRSLTSMLIQSSGVNGNGKHGPSAVKRMWPFGAKKKDS